MRIPFTFTGLDARTDLKRLIDIQARYPNAEFGILYKGGAPVSDPRYKNRFPSETAIRRFCDAGLNLALHICGKLSADIFCFGFQKLDEKLDTTPFRRFQLNGLHNRIDTNTTIKTLHIPEGKELIIQQHPCRQLLTENIGAHAGGTLAMLLDASGGLGIDTTFLPRSVPGIHVGYAGGLNPDNAVSKTKGLLSQGVTDFWLDCENGIRTEDWLDLDKVESILKQIKNM